MRNNIVELVAVLAGLSEGQVSAIVDAVNNTRAANAAIASVEPKKGKRGRKPGTKNKAKVVAKPTAKKAAPPVKKAPSKPAKKSSIPDSFTE